MEQVIPIERIEAEARQAAQRYQDVNAACPYPFGSDAGHAFAQYFKQARAEAQALRDWLADEAPDGAPFCECDLPTTMNERDRNRCDSCGMALT